MRWINSVIAVGCFVTPFAFAEVDLSGTYDLATLTPLQRPAHFGANLFLTAVQAQVLADADKGREEADSQQSAPDREGNYALGNIMRGARILEQDIEGLSASGQD